MLELSINGFLSTESEFLSLFLWKGLVCGSFPTCSLCFMCPSRLPVYSVSVMEHSRVLTPGSLGASLWPQDSATTHPLCARFCQWQPPSDVLSPSLTELFWGWHELRWAGGFKQCPVDSKCHADVCRHHCRSLHCCYNFSFLPMQILVFPMHMQSASSVVLPWTHLLDEIWSFLP